MTIERRESYVIHFYHDQEGNMSARITDAVTQQSWVLRPAFQLRMLIASSTPPSQYTAVRHRTRL